MVCSYSGKAQVLDGITQLNTVGALVLNAEQPKGALPLEGRRYMEAVGVRCGCTVCQALPGDVKVGAAAARVMPGLYPMG